MRLQAVSLGRHIDVWTPRAGVVHSTFDRAVNLLIDGELWTLLDAARPDAPFGIRLAPGPGGCGVRAGDRVHVRAGCLSVGHVVVDCRAASRWTPAPWPQPAAGLGVRLAALERMTNPRAWPESIFMATDVADALRRSGSGSDADLASAVRRTVGRGPGLTPAGDDVLVGVFAVLTSGVAGATDDRAASRLASAMAGPLRSTPDISRHLLDQASRGLTGRALHDLGKTVMEAAPDNLLAGAVERVFDTGGSSGADACMGLVAACRLSFASRRAAA